MPVKYPCLLWMCFFFLDIPPQCHSLVPSNCVRPSLEILRTTPPRWGGASASGGQCVWMRLNSHHSKNTHAPFTRPGQAGGAQSVRSAPGGGEKSPCWSFNAPNFQKRWYEKHTDVMPEIYLPNVTDYYTSSCRGRAKCSYAVSSRRSACSL